MSCGVGVPCRRASRPAATRAERSWRLARFVGLLGRGPPPAPPAPPEVSGGRPLVASVLRTAAPPAVFGGPSHTNLTAGSSGPNAVTPRPSVGDCCWASGGPAPSSCPARGASGPWLAAVGSSPATALQLPPAARAASASLTFLILSRSLFFTSGSCDLLFGESMPCECNSRSLRQYPSSL